MIDPSLENLLASLSSHDLDALLVLGDFLEERGDPRAAELRQMHALLYDDWLFAPLAFQHFNLATEYVLPLFPEYQPAQTPPTNE